MLPMLIGAGIGAGTGMIKSAEEKKQADAQRKIAAATALYSPWTGLTPDTNIKNPSMFGNMMQGAMSGALMGGIAGQAFPDLLGKTNTLAKTTQAAKYTPPIEAQQLGMEMGQGPVSEQYAAQNASTWDAMKQKRQQDAQMALLAQNMGFPIMGLNSYGWGNMPPSSSQMAYQQGY